MSQGDSRLPDGPPREQPTVMRAQGAGVRVREPTTVAPQTRRRRSGVAEDWGPSSRLCTQDPAPHLGELSGLMLPRQRRKEKAGAGAPLGLGEPRDKPLTRRGLRKRARRGEAEGGDPGPWERG